MDQGSHLHPGDDGELSVLIGQTLLGLRDSFVMVMSRARQRVIQGFIVFSIVVLLLWTAAFLYGSFYYSYMPKAAFSSPVHYYYRCVCEVLSSWIRKTKECSFCVFAFTFTQSFTFLSAGQTVNLLPLFCALIQWPTSLWWGIRNMYVWMSVFASTGLSTVCISIPRSVISLKCKFRCWHLARPIGCLCSWRCLILPPTRSWGCSWSRQLVSLGMESKLPPLLALWVVDFFSSHVWPYVYNQIVLHANSNDSWWHCCVFLRQDNCCPPPALALWVQCWRTITFNHTAWSGPD